MANKFTKAVDEFFEHWCRPTGKMIPLFYCHSGDEDGGTDDYEEYGWWEVESMFHNQDAALDNDKYKANKDKCEDEWETLTRLFFDSFSNKLESDFESTNCYWYRYYYITKDYKVKATVARGASNLQVGALDELILDFSDISEDDAELAQDRDTLESIDKHLTSISNLATEIQHNDIRDVLIKKLEELQAEVKNGYR